MPWTREELQDAISAAREAGDTGAVGRLSEELARVQGAPVASNVEKSDFTAEPKETLGKRLTKTAGRTLVSAFSGWPGDIQKASDDFGLTSGGRYFKTTPEIVDLIKRETGIDLTSGKTTDPMEAFPDRAVAGATAMVGPGRGSMGKQALVGALAGVLGEGAVRGTGSENARLPAELASLVGGNITNFRTPNIVKALQSDLKEFTPEDMLKAQSRTNQATAQLKTPAVVSQGFDSPNSLGATMNEVLQSPVGWRLRSALSKQMASAKSLGEQFVDDLTPTKDFGRKAELRVGEVGKAAVEAPAKSRGAKTEQAWKDAGRATLPMNWDTALTNAIEARRRNMHLPEATKGGKVMTQTQKKLAGIADETAPNTSPLDVSALLKEEGKAANLAFASKDPKGGPLNRALGQSQVSQAGDEWLRQNSPEYLAAVELHKKKSFPVDRMRESKMPGIFGKGSGDPSWTKFAKTLTDDTIGPDQVKYIARHLTFADPTKQAFSEVVKQHWQLEWQKAFTNPKGMVNQTGPGEFAVSIAGMPNSPKRAKFLTEMEEVGRIRGLDPKGYAAASQELIEAFQTASRGRESLGKIDTQEFARRRGANWISAAFRTPGLIVGGSPVAAAIERIVGERTSSLVADALLNHQGIEQLMKIKDYSVMKNAAGTLARNILSSAEMAGSVEPEKTVE